MAILAVFNIIFADFAHFLKRKCSKVVIIRIAGGQKRSFTSSLLSDIIYIFKSVLNPNISYYKEKYIALIYRFFSVY